MNYITKVSTLLALFVLTFFIQSYFTFALTTCPGRPASSLTWSSAACTTLNPGFSSAACSFSGANGSKSVSNGTSCSASFSCTGPGGSAGPVGDTLTYDPSLVWNGSACVAPPSGCNVAPWGAISNGSSVTAYQSPSVVSPASCVSQTRTCSGSTLSGTYTNASCTVLPPTVIGSCDNSSRNSCNAGTANDGAVTDDASFYKWRCDGSGPGGTNSGTCQIAKAVFSCTGLPITNANIFASPDDTGLVANTSYTYSGVGDTATKCQYNCVGSSARSGGACVSCSNAGCSGNVCIQPGVGPAPLCTPPSSPSASLTVPNCTIASGASTCTISVSWSSANLVSGLSVRQNGVQFSTAVSNGGTSKTLQYGSGASNSFTAYSNPSTLDAVTGTASCVGGTSWSAGVCVPVGGPTCGPVHTPATSACPGSVKSNAGLTQSLFTWDCTSIGTVSCTEPRPDVDATCGGSVNTCGITGSPVSNIVNGATAWTWTCGGISNGGDTNCSITKPVSNCSAGNGYWGMCTYPVGALINGATASGVVNSDPSYTGTGNVLCTSGSLSVSGATCTLNSCANGATNYPTCGSSTAFCVPPNVWNTSSASCVPPLSVSTPVVSALVLPTTTFTANYVLTNGTGANTDCYLLMNDGVTVLGTDLACTGSFTNNTPASVGVYGYYIKAVKAFTSETKLSGLFTVTVNPGPSVVSVGLLGQYTPAGTLVITCANSDGYRVEKGGVFFASGAYGAVPRNVPVTISGTYVVTCRQGATSSSPVAKDYSNTFPTPPIMSIITSPKTIQKGLQSTVSWKVTYPVATCKIYTEAVCSGTCRSDITSNALRLAEVVSLNAKLNLATEKTDKTDPDGYRNLKASYFTATPSTASLDDKVAAGRKTLILNYTTDFVFDCNAGLNKKKVRVNVTTTNQG